MATINLRGIDDNIHRQARVASAEAGETLTAWVTGAMVMRLADKKRAVGDGGVAREKQEAKSARALAKNAAENHAVADMEKAEAEGKVQGAPASKGKKMSAEQYFALPYSEQARAVREGRY